MATILDKSNKKVFFVAFGASKSGTTWLQKLLNSHPDVECKFQFSVAPFLPPGFRTNIIPVSYAHKSPFQGVFLNNQEENEYWMYNEFLRKLRREVRKFAINLSRNNKKFDQKYLTDFSEWVYAGYIEKITLESKCQAVGTKAYTDIDLAFKLKPDVRFICIVRDGRDVAVSKRFHYENYGIYFHGDEKSVVLYTINKNVLLRKITKKIINLVKADSNNIFGLNMHEKNRKTFTYDSIQHFATEWYEVNQYIQNMVKKYPKNILLIKYEDLKNNGLTTLTNVFHHLGVSHEKKEIRDIIDSNNFLRLRGSKKNSFFRKGISGDWVNHFSERDKNDFKSIAGKLLIELGYEENGNW